MMMELSRSLTLNEEALQQIPSVKRPVFIFEWLRFLDTVLLNAQQTDIKDSQRKLVEQLTNQIECSPGPPTRKLIARCLATLFSVGDTFLLFDTVNKCNDILKNKDDSPSFLPARLAALCCVGSMYEKLGRMMGRSYEETVIILIRSLRGAESQVRVEIMNTLEKICAGMGSAIHNIHKEIYKACRHCLIDRVMSVRCAASRCLLELLNHTTLLYTIELESLATLCFRAFDGSNYEARCAVAKLLGALIAMTQQNPKGSSFSQQKQNTKAISLEEALSVLMLGFLRGGSGFLKGPGEMIKGSSSVNREVRLGVTHAYVIFVQILGGMWLERNITSFLSHVLDLVANPKAASSHVDAVYSRRCINFILRSVIGKMLSEKAQFAACKEIMHFITKQMKSIDYNPENAKDCNQETLFSQHLLVCALQELGSLTLSLGTTAQYLISDASLDLIEGVMMVLIHPCYAARLAAAWCLRCICIAVPSQITPLIDRCIINIEKMRVHPEAISGYSAALAAMLGGVRLSPLGIPHTKGKVIFNIAEELLRSANQNSRLSLHRTQAGWLLIGSIMTLGIPVVRGLLPRMLLLWRNSFPRSNKELESEKARGDAFTWQVTLEGRAGALSAIHSLVLHCPEILTEDILRRLLIPIECALAMLTNISAVLKTYGQNLKAPVVMVRLRLYETLLLLPPQAFEGSYTHLLRMLVAEFTLTENHANTTTSLLRSACHIEDSVILGTRLQETDHRTIEDQLQPNSAAGSGALEHDPCCLYRQLPVGEIVPGPLPLGVAVIDMSVQLFGQIFPRVANKHKLQMLDHFAECIKNTKSSRQEAVQMNVFAALLSGLRGLTEAKTSLGQEDVKKCAAALIIGAITSPNAFLRCAAGESMGRLAQVVGDSRFTAELAQTSFDRLKSARDVASRTGHSLALGCLHRYVGGMGSSQHLNTSVSILLALAQDTTSAIVQMWSLHALALISDSGGPMFRSYVEPTLSLTLKLLLNVPQSYVDVHQCIGKVLSSLITTIGPELQGNTNTICTARSSFLCACSIMQDHPDPLVQAEATGCLQQLHLFVPRHVNLSSLVPTLCRTLSSNHLLLRKAAISCLRQLVHREAKEVCDHALTLANESCDTNIVEGLVITETGLPGVLFSMLDTETDIKLIADIHEILISMLQTLAADNLSQWLGLCKDVLTVSSESSTNSEEGGNNTLSSADERDIDGDDDLADLGVSEDETAAHRTIQPRWPTRVFAAECVRRIINVCSSVSALPAHFDLITAKETHSKMNRGDYLVLHLSNLMRMAFMAATSDCDPLRLEGLKLLQEVIEKFANVPEPEFPGHLLLEQYQAQVGAALRPAFSQETPSHVTAAACEVCSTWIGSRVARDLNDLRRVHQLLVSSLSKLHYKTSNVKLYNESLSTLEKLAILKAWAEVYVVSMSRDGFTGNESAQNEQNIRNEEEVGSFERKNNGKSLSSLVLPQLGSLSKYWFAALRDYALVSLPPEFSSQLPHDGGAFYTTDTMDSARPHYFKFWPPILNAAALWLSLSTLDTNDTPESEQNSSTNINIDEENGNSNIQALNTSDERFHLLFGICMRSLSNAHNCQSSETLIQCLQGLHTILGTSWGHELLMSDVAYPVELCCVLYRLQMTNDTHTIQLLSMKVIKQIVTAAQEQLDIMKKTKQKELIENTDLPQELDLLGEGGSNGILPPHSSVVVSVLNVCVCVLIRHFPTIHSTMSTSLGLKLSQSSNRSDLANKVVVSTFNILERLLHLCSPLGALEIVPVILYLTTEVIKECAIKSIYDTVVLANNPSIQVALHCFSFIAMHKYSKNEQSEHQWKILLKSALAKIVDFAKMSNEENKVDEVTIMLVIAVFILHAPPEVISVPSLQYPCINQLRQCFQSNNPAVKLKAVQTMFSIFGHTNRSVATPYIQALAPQLIESLHTEINIHMFSETDLTVTLEVIATLDALVNIAKPPNRTEILTLLVLILVNFLLDSKSYNAANNPAKSLHEKCLQWLMKIGPKHPEEFKIVISQSVYMRTKLEEAIRRNQNTQSKIKVECSSSKNVVTQQPSIKLKTDFSNFS